MPIEQRVVTARKIGAPAGPTLVKPATPPAADAAEPRRRRRWPRVVIAVVVLVAGAGLALWLLRGSGADDVPEPPEPGAVLAVEPISVNLADGHYLRLGIALQLTADAKEKPDPARALDLAIALYSGRDVEEISGGDGRARLKEELAAEVADAYEGAVMDVYLTSYVTQ